ncbi:MAG: helix-turn-helix domain-containing protein [Trueperaceae bacterium]|nr:helix-turn-helix domain-containing protein [Trueperaceae bacterium]
MDSFSYPNTHLTNPTLAPEAPRMKLEPKQTLYFTGDRAESLFQIKKGMIRFYMTTPEGRSITVRHLVPGDYFGEEALAKGIRQDTAEALTRVETELISPEYLNQSTLNSVIASLSEQMRRVMNYEYHLQQGTLKQRIARYLCALTETPLAYEGDDGNFTLSVTHSFIAEGTSATRESVSALISELSSEGLIASGYAKITLLDMDALQALVDEPIAFL